MRLNFLRFLKAGQWGGGRYFDKMPDQLTAVYERRNCPILVISGMNKVNRCVSHMQLPALDLPIILREIFGRQSLSPIQGLYLY